MECSVKDCPQNEMKTDEGSYIKYVCGLKRDPKNCYHYKFKTRIIDNGEKEREGAGP